MPPVVATISIVARDPKTGEFAVAVQSKFLAVGSVVPHAAAEVGAVATQAWANVSFGPRGLDLLRSGLTAQEAVERLAAEDDGREHRQFGIVDRHGNAAAYTGTHCMQWAGHRIGPGYTCQGNILVSAATVDAMAERFEETAHLPHIADRVLAALSAGQNAGGDSRGKQSAALFAVREKGGYGGFNDRLVDLRVDDHPEPISELQRLMDLHRQVWLAPTPPERYFLNSPEKIRLLQSLLRELGVFDGSVSGELTYNTRGSLAAFCAENGLQEMDPSGKWLPGETIYSIRALVMQQRQRR